MTQKKKETQEEQSRRFIETARELECDESGETFKRAIRKVAKAKVPKVKPTANKKEKKQ